MMAADGNATIPEILQLELSQLRVGCSDQRACDDCKWYIGGCDIHTSEMLEELAKYYREPYYHPTSAMAPNLLSTNRIYEHRISEMFPLHAFLAYRLSAFCDKYDMERECFRHPDDCLKHGRLLDISFNVDSFPNVDAQPRQHYDYHVMSRRNPYFTMGAIFCMESKSDDFCCLFEDGKYIISDCEHWPQRARQRPVNSQLQYLTKVVVVEIGVNSDAGAATTTTTTSVDTGGQAVV